MTQFAQEGICSSHFSTVRANSATEMSEAAYLYPAQFASLAAIAGFGVELPPHDRRITFNRGRKAKLMIGKMVRHN